MINERLIKKFANSTFIKITEILKFIASKPNGVTVFDVELFWEQHEDGRKMTRSAAGEKRIVDNTIRNLLNKLVLSDCLFREKVGKTYLYFMDNNNQNQIKVEDSEGITDLIRWALTLKKYKGLIFFEELEEILNISIEDILAEDNLKLDDIRPFIDFETTDEVYSGWGKNVFADQITSKVSDHMAYFYKIISFENETVEFTYRSFQIDEIRKVSHAEPYLLKEHNKRWYLIAFDPEKNEVFPFSIDRIIDISANFKSKKYQIPRDFNPKTYWKDCVGVYKDNLNGPQKVSFELKDGPRYNNQKYLISSPMHASQKAIKLENGWMRFEYFIHIGPEVVRQIRQWGIDNLRNIEPKQLDEDIRFG